MLVKEIIKFGINRGRVLEIGPGPGYLGLDWLNNTENTHLTGIDISRIMVQIAARNAREYLSMEDRAQYVYGDGQAIPFEDNSFDAVFTTSSLHEWEDPVAVLKEINRVLKMCAPCFISDFRRDVSGRTRWLLKTFTPKPMQSGLLASLDAAYTKEETTALLNQSPFKRYQLLENQFFLMIRALKSRP